MISLHSLLNDFLHRQYRPLVPKLELIQNLIFQSDYYKILNDGETNQKRIEENGRVVLVSDFDSAIKNGYKVIRGTPEKLMSQLIDENFSVDPHFDDDFLLTHRTFLKSTKVMEYLLGKFMIFKSLNSEKTNKICCTK